jgi:PfaD family protein
MPLFFSLSNISWQGETANLSSDEAQQRTALLQLGQAVYAVSHNQQTYLTTQGQLAAGSGLPVLAFAPAQPIESLGDPGFRTDYALRYAYYGGAMANAIASEAMVIALGQAGLMGSFGAAGLVPARLEESIQRIQNALPHGPAAFNLINSPFEPLLEQRAVELYLKHQIHVIEASAYLDMTPNLVYYRAAGLSQTADGQVQIGNRIIAKLSRKEVAKRFLQPAPDEILNKLVEEGKISALQANLARRIPMADDITVEADSGGHTDNRPLVCVLPVIIAMRDEYQAKYQYAKPVRIGAGGGISTPASALAAFSMGAAYLVTGSINQACVESGASNHTKNLLAQVSMTDVAMAPAADMFEMGVKVQVLKRGTMFAMRAQKLYDLYARYESWETVPEKERERLESQVFKRSYNEIWTDTLRFFTERDPRQIERAASDPHQQMALVFRWYLGLSSRWSNTGEKGREMDYQIWCGPSMGAFNDWSAGTPLAESQNRHVVPIALQILTGCAYLARLRQLEAFGVRLPASLANLKPDQIPLPA